MPRARPSGPVEARRGAQRCAIGRQRLRVVLFRARADQSRPDWGRRARAPKTRRERGGARRREGDGALLVSPFVPLPVPALPRSRRQRSRRRSKKATTQPARGGREGACGWGPCAPPCGAIARRGSNPLSLSEATTVRREREGSLSLSVVPVARATHHAPHLRSRPLPPSRPPCRAPSRRARRLGERERERKGGGRRRGGGTFGKIGSWLFCARTRRCVQSNGMGDEAGVSLVVGGERVVRIDIDGKGG